MSIALADLDRDELMTLAGRWPALTSAELWAVRIETAQARLQAARDKWAPINRSAVAASSAASRRMETHGFDDVFAARFAEARSLAYQAGLLWLEVMQAQRRIDSARARMRREMA